MEEQLEQVQEMQETEEIIVQSEIATEETVDISEAPVEEKVVPKKKTWVAAVAGAAVILAVALFLIFKPTPVEEITLSKASIELITEETLVLSYAIKPEWAADTAVKWTTSDDKVATVDAQGKVVAVGEGSCVITATAGKKSDVATVRVTELKPEEKMVVGTWNAFVSVNAEDDDITMLPANASDIVLCDDYTGYVTLKSETALEFTWKYNKTDDGSYYYSAILTDGDEMFNFSLTDYEGEDTIVAKVGDLYVFYQK